MRNFKSVRFAWSKEILNGVVMCKATKPQKTSNIRCWLRGSASTIRPTKLS